MPGNDSQSARPATRVVIDTDPGIDDAAAILLALASSEVNVLGITSVAGNVSLERSTPRTPLTPTTQNQAFCAPVRAAS